MWKYENTYHLVSQHIINTWKNPVFCTWLLLSPPLCLSANVSLAETRHDHLDKWHSQSPVYMLPCFIFLHGTYHHQVYVYLIIRYYLSPIPLLCCCLVTKSWLFVKSMDCSTPGFPVLHYLPELGQIHIHWLGDAIQPFHPLSPPSLLALNLFQHQGPFGTIRMYTSWEQELHFVNCYYLQCLYQYPHP